MRASSLGFTHVEIAGLAERPPDHLEALADSGVLVACALLSGDLSNGSSAIRLEILQHRLNGANDERQADEGQRDRHAERRVGNFYSEWREISA